MIKKDLIIGYDEEVVKSLTEKEFIDQHKDIDLVKLKADYKSITAKESKEEKKDK